MAYLYKPSSHAFRFPKAEERPRDGGLVVEYRFDDSISEALLTAKSESFDLPSRSLSTRLLVALTCCIGGLQLVYATIFSHGSAYLFSLGISRSQSSLIWAIAPVCGTVIHPLVGAISDRARCSWGRRRPFILGGAIGVMMALTALAWIEPLTLQISLSLGITSDVTAKIATQYGVILCFLVLNVATQPLQSGIRALMVDTCPTEQQSMASAWAGRFIGLGNILGYILGSLPLAFVTSHHETWRFRYLSLLSVIVLGVTVAITTSCIEEENPQDTAYETESGLPFFRIFRDVRNGLCDMPPQAWNVCKVQFFAWLGWFGFLYYSTSYISHLYIEESRRHGDQYSTALEAEGMRVGTAANLLFAVVALGTAILLPHIGHSTDWRTSNSGRLESIRQTHVIWALSHLHYAACVAATFFVSSSTAGTLLIASIGLTCGVMQWAPFALIGEEIATHQAEQESAPECGGKQWVSKKSGAMMGIHNAAISIPQILAALGSSLIFWMARLAGSESGEEAGTAWVLRASGLAALVAAWFAWKLKHQV